MWIKTFDSYDYFIFDLLYDYYERLKGVKF